jgi:hypothetical protein
MLDADMENIQRYRWCKMPKLETYTTGPTLQAWWFGIFVIRFGLN